MYTFENKNILLKILIFLFNFYPIKCFSTQWYYLCFDKEPKGKIIFWFFLLFVANCIICLVYWDFSSSWGHGFCQSWGGFYCTIPSPNYVWILAILISVQWQFIVLFCDSIMTCDVDYLYICFSHNVCMSFLVRCL